MQMSITAQVNQFIASKFYISRAEHHIWKIAILDLE